MKSTLKILALGGLLLAAGNSLIAGPSKEVMPPPLEPITPAKDWEVRVTVPGWLASIDGDIGVLGRTVDASTDFKDIADELDLVLALAVDVRVHRFLFAIDGQYTEVSVSAEPEGFARALFKNATLDIKQGIVEAYFGYRIIDTESFDWDLLGGARYNHYEAELTLDGTERRNPRTGREFALTRNRSASTKQDWVDPLVATRVTYHFTPAISVIASGDIGGFGAASDLTWEAYGGLRADVTRNIYLEAGYRHQATDYTHGGFIYDTALDGPQIILGLRF